MGGRERESPHTPWALEGGPWGGKIKRKTQATSGKLCEKRKIKRKNKKNYKNDQKWIGNIGFLPEMLIISKTFT